MVSSVSAGFEAKPKSAFHNGRKTKRSNPIPPTTASAATAKGGAKVNARRTLPAAPKPIIKLKSTRGENKPNRNHAPRDAALP